MLDTTSNTSPSAQNDYVGGFVGLIDGGTISNSGAWGTVMGPYSVGGFAGYQNGGTIQTSFANTGVTAGDALLVANTSIVGGFIGKMNSGTITSSRAAGAVAGLGKVGGFVGAINNGSTINQSYETGAVTQTSTSNTSTAGGVGGFAGYLESSFTGTISDFYAMGSVTGTQNVGGLIGYADRGTLTNGYATGMTSFNTVSNPSPAKIGGVFGNFNTTINRVTNSNLYWDTDTSNQSASGGFGTGLTTAQFKSTLANTAGFNASNTNWNTSAGLFPYLQVFYPTQARALEGYAYLSDGTTVAKRAQVGQYTSGTLLNGGTASTGVNGYYYSVVGSNTLFTDAAIPEAVASIAVTSGGGSYVSNGTLALSGGGGTGATATASRVNATSVLTNSLQSVNVTNGGSGYISAPNITTSGWGVSASGATFSVTLSAPFFNTTQLGTLLMLDGNSTVNATVAGMSYTDRIQTDNTAYLYKDSNTNVIGKVVQGITRLSTQNSSASGMNTDLNTTIGTTKRSSFASNLTTISSLELFSRASSFTLDTPLSYADNGVANAGNITITGNSSVTLTGGTFVSTKAQTYNATLTLGADATLNATTVTTNSTLVGGNYNLTVNNVTAANSGNLVTGGDFTGLGNLWVTGNSSLNGNVTSSGNQTFNGTLT